MTHDYSIIGFWATITFTLFGKVIAFTDANLAATSQIIAIAVGLMTLVNNWPKFKARIKFLANQFLTWCKSLK